MCLLSAKMIGTRCLPAGVRVAPVGDRLRALGWVSRPGSLPKPVLGVDPTGV